jgi:hypothetical protein
MLLKAVKAFHTVAWFSIEACMLYVLYSGIRRQSDRGAGGRHRRGRGDIGFRRERISLPSDRDRTQSRRQQRIRY